MKENPTTALARQLERTEAAANIELVEARALLFPASGACWMEEAGTSAMFDSPGSPITQSFGLGLFAETTAGVLEKVENFFHSRNAAAVHEISSLAAKPLLPLLAERGYRAVELTDVMAIDLEDHRDRLFPPHSTISVRLARDDEGDLWAAIAAEGWREQAELAEFIPQLMRILASRRGALNFFGEKDHRQIATGGLFAYGDIALLAGASTIPEFRRQGAHRALFEARLEYAARIGCTTAMICVEPGSESQGNAFHYGFRIAYTRIKWALDPPGTPRLRN